MRRRITTGQIDYGYWAQQPMLWGIFGAMGLFGWSLIEFLSLQKRVDTITDTLRLIEKTAQAGDVNTERRLTELQSKSPAIDQNQKNLANLQAASQSLDQRITLMQREVPRLDELQEIDNSIINRLQALEIQGGTNIEQLESIKGSLTKLAEAEAKINQALARLQQAETRFDAVQETYEALTDAQKYVDELQESRAALARAEAQSQTYITKAELAQTQQEILGRVNQALEQQAAAFQRLKSIEPSVKPRRASQPSTHGGWVIPLVVVGVIGFTSLMVWLNWKKPKIADPIRQIDRARRHDAYRTLDFDPYEDTF